MRKDATEFVIDSLSLYIECEKLIAMGLRTYSMKKTDAISINKDLYAQIIGFVKNENSSHFENLNILDDVANTVK